MYIDVYFFVNLIMDWLSLKFALRQYDLTEGRLWLGAVMGALGACVWEIAEVSILLRPMGTLLLAVCMVYCCLGKRTKKQWMRSVVEVYIYGFVFAGVIPYISQMIPLWSGSVLISYVCIRMWLWWAENRKSKPVSVTFEIEEERKKLRAMVDTGHRLVEPITGRPVVIVRGDCIPETVEPRWPICFESVQGKGVMFGFWPEKLWIDDRLYKKREILVAVALEWDEQNWDALVPGYVMES